MTKKYIKPVKRLDTPEIQVLKDLLVSIDKQLNNKKKYEKIISDLDTQLSVYLHQLEFLNLSAAEMMKLTKALKNLLIVRRRYKNIISTYNSACSSIKPATTIKYIDGIVDKTFTKDNDEKIIKLINEEINL